MSDKLHISNEMAQFDLKNRKFFDQLSEEEQKKFNPFIMVRWGATVEGSAELQSYYLMSTNENFNKNFFDVNSTEHKKLHWLMATTVSPGMGRQRHNWLAGPKKDNTNNKTEKFLKELYPTYRDDEIALLAEINTKDDLKALAKSHGWDDKRIKEFL
jgi:hypothetical protein